MTCTTRTRGSASFAVLFLIVAVVIAAVAFVVLKKDSPAGFTPKSAPTETAANTPAPEANETAVRSADVDAREPKRSAKGINFSVVCLGPNGASDAIAGLEIVAAPAIAVGTDQKNAVTQTTDSSGKAEFTNLPYTIYELNAAPAGYVPLRLRGAKDGKKHEMIFQKGVPLSGKVVNAETQAPVAGAFVQVYTDFGSGAVQKRIQLALQQGVKPEDIQDYETLTAARAYFRIETTSDESGNYSFSAVPSNAILTLAVEHRSFDAFDEILTTKGTDPITHDLRLFTRIDIFGKVVSDETGDPIVGAKVQAAEGGIPLDALVLLGKNAAEVFESVSDANGAYRLKKLPRGDQYVVVRFPGFDEYSASFTVSGSEADYEHEIRLKRSASLSGQVVDVANMPVEGVSIYWVVADAQIMGTTGLPKEPHARSAADGTFQLRDVPVGRTFNVLGRHPDYVPAIVDRLVVQPGDETTGIKLTMNHGGSIVGDVVDALKRPIAGAIVIATPVKPTGAARPPVTSGPDGTFAINNTPAATFEVTAESPGYCKGKIGNVRDVATGVQFVLVKEAIYSGRFINGSNEPLSKFKVRLRTSDGPSEREIRSEAFRDKDGKFEIRGLAPGLWDFEFTAENMTPLLVERVAFREGERIESQELRIPEGCRVGGTVRSLSGKPVQNALVRLDFLEPFSPSDKTFTTLQASTNSNGEYEIKNLLSGRYLVWASHPSFAPVAEREIVVDPGPRAEISFNLPKPASLRVVVRDEEGNTVPQASVWLFQGDSPASSAKKIVGTNGMVGLEIPKGNAERSGIAVTTDEASNSGPKVQVGETGEVSFQRKEPGKWTLWVTAPGCYKYAAILNLEAGKESVHEAELKKLQPGISERDAYADAEEQRRKRNELRHPQQGEDERDGALANLSPEERAVLSKQRNGEELTAEEMKILKQARGAMREGGKESGKGAASEEDKTARKNERAESRKAAADTDGDGKMSKEEREALRRKQERKKQRREQEEGGDEKPEEGAPKPEDGR